MASVNKAIIIGRIGKDPEIRYTQSGQAVATLSVATDESYKDQSGQRVEKTEWHKVVVWGKQADFVANYLTNLPAGLTHYGTTTGPILFSQGYVSLKEWWTAGAVVGAANLAIWLTVGLAWWRVLGFW